MAMQKYYKIAICGQQMIHNTL